MIGSLQGRTLRHVVTRTIHFRISTLVQINFAPRGVSPTSGVIQRGRRSFLRTRRCPLSRASRAGDKRKMLSTRGSCRPAHRDSQTGEQSPRSSRETLANRNPALRNTDSIISSSSSSSCTSSVPLRLNGCTKVTVLLVVRTVIREGPQSLCIPITGRRPFGRLRSSAVKNVLKRRSSATGTPRPEPFGWRAPEPRQGSCCRPSTSGSGSWCRVPLSSRR
jgi:hypothetical protein